MKPQFFSMLLLVCLLTAASKISYCQRDVSHYVAPTLWAKVEAGITDSSQSDFNFIADAVRRHCGTNPDTLYRNYYALMIKMERLFNLPAAIFIAREMEKLAIKQKNESREAEACLNLNRYYDAMGIPEPAMVNIDKALAIYAKLGNTAAVIDASFTRLQQGLKGNSFSNVLPKMKQLLQQAKATGNQRSIIHLQLSILPYTIQAGEFAYAESLIAELEKIPVSIPVKQTEYPRIIIVAQQRAELAIKKNNLSLAKQHFLQTLQYCREEPSRWLEVYILNRLTELEWQQGNLAAAKSYLDQAQSKAEQLNLHDLLVYTYELQSSIAEKEHRYKDAFTFLTMKNAQEEQLKLRNAGFNMQNYYLQREKQQLATESKNKALELSLKNAQLKYSGLFILFVLVLATALLIGLYKHRAGNRTLAQQNAIIQQHAQTLEDLDAAKSKFFANISHELRTPLALIVGPVSTLLNENQLTPKQARLLQIAGSNALQLRLMIDDILDLRKMEMHKMTVKPEHVALATFFRTHIEQFTSMAVQKDIHFQHHINIAEDQVAAIDRSKCRQILNNLLSNAFKFTPKGGEINVDIRLKGNQLEFKVTDNGPGIKEPDMPHVFDRFFQSTDPNKAVVGGTGIGLSLCAEYARLFNGNINVESEPGKFTVFHFSFPVELVDAEHNLAVNTERLPEMNKPYFLADQITSASKLGEALHASEAAPTLMIVEDNPELQEYIRTVLQHKYKLLTAGNGQEALEILSQKTNHQPIDLIISDLMMPLMDGYELLKNLKSTEQTCRIPVIMLTARAEAADRLKALRVGVDDYMTKPFDEEELLVRIENLLTNQHIRRTVFAEEQATAQTDEPGHSLQDQEWLEKFESFIQQHISSDLLNIGFLSNEFAMSDSTLLRQLKRLTGLTPQQYLTEVRLDHARMLIENGIYESISRVAAQVGYADTRTFSKGFKKRFGKLPSELV